DEPNANLDRDGELALLRAIEALRGDGRIVVLVSHRSDAIAALDIAMELYEGRMIAFGPREQIFARVKQAATPLAAQGPSAHARTRGHPEAQHSRPEQPNLDPRFSAFAKASADGSINPPKPLAQAGRGGERRLDVREQIKPALDMAQLKPALDLAQRHART